MTRKTSETDVIWIFIAAVIAAPIAAVWWLYSVIGPWGMAAIALSIAVAAAWWWKRSLNEKTKEGLSQRLREHNKKVSSLIESQNGFRNHVDEFECSIDSPDWDETLDSSFSSSPKAIRAQLEIQYRDAEGSETRRKVDVRECDIESKSGYLIGICKMRNAYRTFRMDRVRHATDLETGEVIDNLPEWAKRKYQESPAFAIETLIDESSDVLRALFYIGKADGRFTRKEKQVFLDYCTRNLIDRNLNIDDIDRICNQLDIPSKQAFKLICGRLSKFELSQRLAIISAADDMVATEKTIGAEEADALDYMKKRLSATT